MLNIQSAITRLNGLDFSKLNTLCSIEPQGWAEGKHFHISLKFRASWIAQVLLKIVVHMQETAHPGKLFPTLVSFIPPPPTFSPSVTQIYQEKMLKSMMMQLRLWLHDDSKSILKQIISTVGQKERQTLWKSNPLISLRFHNPREHL